MSEHRISLLLVCFMIALALTACASRPETARLPQLIIGDDRTTPEYSPPPDIPPIIRATRALINLSALADARAQLRENYKPPFPRLEMRVFPDEVFILALRAVHAPEEYVGRLEFSFILLPTDPGNQSDWAGSFGLVLRDGRVAGTISHGPMRYILEPIEGQPGAVDILKVDPGKIPRSKPVPPKLPGAEPPKRDPNTLLSPDPALPRPK